LNCEACEMYQAAHDHNEAKLKTLVESAYSKFGERLTVNDLVCDGCLGEGNLTPWCRKCQIRLCNRLGSGKIRCSDCAEFPCKLISDFCHDGAPHHAEVLYNLRRIQEVGIEEWAEKDKYRWTCPKCQNLLSWYDPACQKCGELRSIKLFQLQTK
jgi:hypothetical protein